MRNLLIYTFLFVFTFPVFAQKTISFEGPFINGLPVSATARYAYYLDNFGNKIKHGSFRYLVKEKTTNTRITQNFNGNFVNGLKNGSWEYIIKSKDFLIDKEGYAESVDMNLLANYKNGLPHGEWIYNALITKRLKSVNNGKEVYSNFKTIKNLAIHVNFKNGILVDSLQIFDFICGDTILVFANESGLIHGDFYANNSSKLFHSSFFNGILESKNGAVVPEFQLYKKSLESNSNQFIIDTLSLLNDRSNKILFYLNDNIFNKDYFLYERIDGDLIFNKNSKGLILGTQIKGLFYLDFKPILKSSQNKIIDDISYYLTKIIDFQTHADYKLKQNPKNEKAKKLVSDLKLIRAEVERYYCSAKLTQEVVLMADLYKKSNASCGNLPQSFSTLKSKDQWLNELLLASRKAWIRAESLSK